MVWKIMTGVLAGFLNGARKLSSKDQMEAAVAASIMVANADGNIEPSELSSLDGSLHSIPAMKSFGKDLDDTINRMVDQAKANRHLANVRLEKEIKDIANRPLVDREEVFAIAYGVAEANGDISKEEITVLRRIAQILGVSTANYTFVALKTAA